MRFTPIEPWHSFAPLDAGQLQRLRWHLRIGWMSSKLVPGGYNVELRMRGFVAIGQGPTLEDATVAALQFVAWRCPPEQRHAVLA